MEMSHIRRAALHILEQINKNNMFSHLTLSGHAVSFCFICPSYEITDVPLIIAFISIILAWREKSLNLDG